MTSISKDKQAKNQERFQSILQNMLREDENKYCADCESKGTKYQDAIEMIISYKPF